MYIYMYMYIIYTPNLGFEIVVPERERDQASVEFSLLAYTANASLVPRSVTVAAESLTA